MQNRNQRVNVTALSKRNFSGLLMSTILIILLSSFYTTAQQCSLTLSAKNNIESVNDEGRVFFITLRNNSDDAIPVSLSVVNDNTGLNPDNTATGSNVILNAKILNNAGQEMNDVVKLSAKESLYFQVKVTVPMGTAVEHWNSVRINAASEKCAGIVTSLVLNTFVPNPNEK